MKKTAELSFFPSAERRSHGQTQAASGRSAHARDLLRGDEPHGIRGAAALSADPRSAGPLAADGPVRAAQDGGAALAYLYELGFDVASFNYYTFLTQLYSYRLVDSYWYLYCYLGYLLALPLLRRLAAAMRGRDYQYLAALWLVIKSVELLPVFALGESLERSETFVLFLLDYNVFFPLMGHYLEKRLDEKRFTARGAALAALAALLSLALMCLATERWCRAQGQWPAYAGELTFGALNFVIALALFYIAKTLFLRRSIPTWAVKTMALFGSCSFGLYLLQHYFLRWLRPVFEAAQPRLGTYPACLLWVLCVCLAGSAVTLLLRQIPGIKKLI